MSEHGLAVRALDEARILRRVFNDSVLDTFEQLMLEQPAAQPWVPVTDYSWDARKDVDGPTADLIAATFPAERILDFGCGHGHLQALLCSKAGLWVEAYDPHSPVFAQYPRGQYDLVVCREVLEHVELRKYLGVVRELCDLSKRWVYLTTRFHPDPQHLLDVATSDELDPTHITMLNQDFLRALFVLHGFKRDREKEQTMDHLKKGRVLVYERVTR